ncbi:MAG: glycosyltransferase [Elusimicrobia bacterium]|nr:glycosyltransferase [Elusimicrobiota bacterium]
MRDYTPIKLSLVILTYRRLASVLRCLSSLREMPRPDVEALVVLNGREADNPLLLEELAAKYSWAKAFPIERSPRGLARNLAASRARGKLVYFLDDDVVVPEGFISSVLEAAGRHPLAPALGGPHLGTPEASDFQAAADFLLRSPLGAGPLRARHSPGSEEGPAPGWKFTLCNLAFRREIFELHGLRFPDRCASAEENLLLFEVEEKLGLPVFSPSLYVYHERRNGLLPFMRQTFLCGKGRGEITRIKPLSLHPAIPVPLLFAAYLLAWPVLPRAAAFAAPLLAYGTLALLESARLLLRQRRWRAGLWLAVLFPAAHLSYALGLARGLCSRP